MGENYKYMVCTRCFTYNHKKYITDAMNGFVMQQTDFSYVCTIVDDASTDGEQDVIRKYLNENFDLKDSTIAYEKDTDYGHVTFARHKSNKNCYFAVIYLNENHYSQKKSKAPYLTEWINAKYIALCEGDDYWTDPLKLQKQVEYMEKHEECCMCTHATNWETNGNIYRYGCQYDYPCDLTTDEVIRNGGLYIATNSLVYKSWLNNDRPEWRRKSSVGDFPLQILGTLRGSLHYLPDTMSVYRYMREESWTARQFGESHLDSNDANKDVEYAKNKILWFGLLDKDTNFQYTKVIYSHLYQYYNVLYHAGEISFSEYFRAAMKADNKHYIRVCKDFIIHFFEPVYKIWLRLAGKKNIIKRNV